MTVSTESVAGHASHPWEERTSQYHGSDTTEPKGRGAGDTTTEAFHCGVLWLGELTHGFLKMWSIHTLIKLVLLGGEPPRARAGETGFFHCPAPHHFLSGWPTAKFQWLSFLLTPLLPFQPPPHGSLRRLLPSVTSAIITVVLLLGQFWSQSGL